MRICLLFFLLLNVYGFCWSYSKDQYYTGGFGGEVFVSPINASTEFNIVFQLKRFIASASYSIDDDFYQSWNALFGVDVFENKYFKVVPFVGGYDPWMAGLQFEYRPYISGVANDVPMGIYTNNENNICENVTYQRLKTVITGKRHDGSEYSQGIPANLKYFRTDFVDKDSEDLSEELLNHIREMIELEHGIKIDDKKYVIILDDEEMDEFTENIEDYPELKAVFISSDILLTGEQSKMLETIDTYIIPDHYFDFELREAGEIW